MEEPEDARKLFVERRSKGSPETEQPTVSGGPEDPTDALGQ